jgi:hypothetical protein
MLFVQLCIAFYQTSGYKKLKNSSQVEKVRKFNCNKNCRFEVAANDGETITLKAVQYDFVHADSIRSGRRYHGDQDQRGPPHDQFQHLPADQESLVAKHFIYGYCRTGHSLQGVTIRDKITVCDWRYLERQDPVRLRKWLYVAITRATSLDDVQIFAGGNAEFNDQLWKLYLKKKVMQYKEQDKRANREMDPENYITEQWLDDNLCNVCIHCQLHLRCELQGVQGLLQPHGGPCRQRPLARARQHRALLHELQCAEGEAVNLDLKSIVRCSPAGLNEEIYYFIF